MPSTVDTNPTTERYENACSGCGSCCEVIGLRGSRDAHRFWLEHADRSNPAGADAIANAEFVIAHLKPIDRDIALRLNPLRVAGDPLAEYYLCDNYDQETRRCLDYEHRPPLCRDFPTYAEGLEARVRGGGLAAFPRCSYWRLLSKDQWPPHVTEETVTPLPPTYRPANCC